MKEAIEAAFEAAKTELHQALDKVALDSPTIVADLAELADKHNVIGAFVSVLSKL